MRRRYVALGVVVFIVAALVAYTQLLDDLADDESLIRSAIRTIADSAEERDLRAISRHVHADFHSEAQNMDRATAMAVLRRIFLSYPVIRVKVRGVSVKIIDETTAEARFIATVRAASSAASSGENLLRHRGSERFLLTFKKEGDRWQIIRSRIIRSTAD